MRKHLSFASTKKSTHIRRRYSHDVSRPQLIQENINIDIQYSQSTLHENIQDNYDDNMDFQYNYRSEGLPKDEDRESSKEDENEESSEDENEESSEDENKEFSEDENQESSEDENEESSEDENQESSEDENEEASEDENEESSEDENNEDDDNEDELSEYDNIIYELSEDEEKYDNIIDKALDEDKMLSYDNNNEFALYFENITTASLFCWLQKHNISTNTYENLAEIIHNPQFMPTHVIKNVRRFHKWRQHLPLLSISERSIYICIIII